MYKGIMALGLLLGLLVSGTEAATRYVARNGDNNRSCSEMTNESTPRQTIGAGITCLQGGDTLIVKAGTYNECISDNLPNGSSGSPTTLQGEGIGKTVLRPTCKSGDGVAIVSIGLRAERDWIAVRDLTINAEATSPPTYGITIRSPSGDDASWTRHITIDHVEITRIPWVDNPNNSGGIAVAAGTQYLTIINNDIHEIGMQASSGAQFLAYCMYWSGKDSLVEGNRFSRCSGYGIHGYHNQSLGSGGGGGSIIRGNLIENNGAIGLLMCPGNNQIYNNILRNNGWHGRDPGGMQIGGYCSGVKGDNNKIYHNTLYQNQPFCIRLGRSSSASANNNSIRDNICDGNGGGNGIRVENGSGNDIAANLTGSTQPVYMTMPPVKDLDFKLTPDSPGHNQGDSSGPVVSTVTDDYAGQARGAVRSIGAFESSAVVVVPPTPPELMASWEFEAINGNAVADLSEKAHALTLQGNPSLGPGRVGAKALLLNGTQYGQTPGLLVNGARAVSLTAWFNAVSVPNRRDEIVSLGDTVSIFVDARQLMGFYYTGGGSWVETVELTNYIGTGWHHVAYVVDPGAGIQVLYVDGVVRASSRHTKPIVYTDLGANTVVGGHGNGMPWRLDGGIDQVQVYNYAISQAEVQRLVATPPVTGP